MHFPSVSIWAREAPALEGEGAASLSSVAEATYWATWLTFDGRIGSPLARGARLICPLGLRGKAFGWGNYLINILLFSNVILINKLSIFL